jgi:hypothetical protein
MLTLDTATVTLYAPEYRPGVDQNEARNEYTPQSVRQMRDACITMTELSIVKHARVLVDFVPLTSTAAMWRRNRSSCNTRRVAV